MNARNAKKRLETVRQREMVSLRSAEACQGGATPATTPCVNCTRTSKGWPGGIVFWAVNLAVCLSSSSISAMVK